MATTTAPPQPAPDALAKIEEAKPLGIQRTIGLGPRTFEEAWRFAKLIAGSDLAPKDYIDKPANVLVAIQMGAEVGLSPMAAIQNIAVINGRPSLWGDAALAVVMVHPAYEWHKEKIEGTGDAKVAIFEIKRKGNDPHVSRFTIADAKKANLVGKAGPWTNYPDRMLAMRARGFGLRDKFADALRGLSIAEEALDLPPMRTVDAHPESAASVAAQLPANIQRASDIAATQPDQSITEAQAKLEEQRKQPVVDAPLIEAKQECISPALNFGSIIGND